MGERFDAPPFVGRVEEVELLDDLVARVERGLSGSLVVLGDPGVGKTRLLERLDAAATSVVVRRVVGMESELRLGFAALHRLLLPFSERIDSLPAPQRDALLTTFGVLDGPPPPKLLIGLAALTLLAEAARDRPLICVLDDAHWLDRESLAIAAFVARRIHADGIGIVVAGRENHPELAALDGLPTHHLGGLDRADAYSLLSAVGPQRISSLVTARIVAETGANPLAMLEVVGQLTTAQLEGRLPLPHQLPTGRGLNVHFLRQIEVLPAETRSLLLLAAAMSNDEASPLHRAAALIGLSPGAGEPATRAGLLTIDDNIRFRHPVIRSAVYRSASHDERRAAHAALAAIADGDGDADLAAWHRAAATTTPDEDLAAGLVRSAGRAERRGGQVAQALFLGRAAELSPEPRDRSLRLLEAAKAYLAAGDGILAEALLDKAAPWLESDGRHVDVQRLRASVAVFFSRHRDAPGILMDAVTQIDPQDPRVREMLFDALQASLVARRHTVGVTPSDVARRALETHRPDLEAASAADLLLDGFATRLAVGYTDAVPLLRAAVGSLFDDTDAGTRRVPTTILGWFAADDIWDDSGRSAMFERAARLEREHGSLGALRITLAGLCVSQALAGEMEKAEQSYAEAAEISTLIGIPAPATTGVLLEVRAWQGREKESRETAEVTTLWGSQQGAEILEVFAWFGLTILDIGLGDYAAAAKYADEIYDRDPPGFGNRVLPEVVEAGVRTGDIRHAASALDRLTQRAEASGTPWAIGMLARSRALLAGDTEAESYYSLAIEHLENTLVRTELARAHLLYGEWLRRRRRRRDAQEQLSTAYDMFHRMGADAFAARARAELLATGYRSAPGAPRADSGLTPQESQVARLAASGATNAEVASRMFVTTSTVEYHLSKIYRKLGISSRRELARALS